MTTQREAFEKWLEDTSGFTEDDEGIAWSAWQASRSAALEEAAILVDAEADNARDEHYYPGVVGAFEEGAASIRRRAKAIRATANQN